MSDFAHPDTFELPETAPVMFLPGVVLLPHTLLPLYIFEPRYRAMLAYVLEKDRMFCVALMRPGVTEVHKADDFHSICGLGLVRACVGREDGTSHLILQGLARVELGLFRQERPFRIATIQPLPDPPSSNEAPLLAEELRDLCIRLAKDRPELKQIQEQITEISYPSILADTVAHTFLQETGHQQQVLDTLDVAERLQLVTRHLREETGS